MKMCAMCTKVRKVTHWKLGIFIIGTLTMPNSKEQMKKYIPENILILLSQRRRNKMIHMILNEKGDLSVRTCAQSQL